MSLELMMLSPLLVNNHGTPWVPNVWKLWVDHIIKEKKFNFQKACLVNQSGQLVSYSSGFVMGKKEIETLMNLFQPSSAPTAAATDECSTLTLMGKTYVMKTRDQKHIVAFNGDKYYIIAKSLRMYVVAMVKTRTKSDGATEFILNLCRKLQEKNY